MPFGLSMLSMSRASSILGSVPTSPAIINGATIYGVSFRKIPLGVSDWLKAGSLWHYAGHVFYGMQSINHIQTCFLFLVSCFLFLVHLRFSKALSIRSILWEKSRPI
jgi:uncharacterized membrane protein (GlpM family)